MAGSNPPALLVNIVVRTSSLGAWVLWYRSTRASATVFIDSVIGHSNEELRTALTTAHTVSRSSWSCGPIDRRLAILGKLASLIEAKADAVAAMLACDGSESGLGPREEVSLGIEILRYYAAKAPMLLAPIDNDALSGTGRIELHPIGLILAEFTPSLSFYRLVRLIGCNIAVGNAVLLRHAVHVPDSAILLRILLESSGAPRGAWTDILASEAQWIALVTDERVRGIAIGNARKPFAASDWEVGHKRRIRYEQADIFAVSDDAHMSTEWSRARPFPSNSLLTSFTSTVLEHPAVAPSAGMATSMLRTAHGSKAFHRERTGGSSPL